VAVPAVGMLDPDADIASFPSASGHTQRPEVVLLPHRDVRSRT
jgi:hypothetical protein